MTRVAWFHCFAGVAGDMTLAALVDAGADPLAVADVLGGLGVEGWALTFEAVQRCGVRATWADVTIHHPDQWLPDQWPPDQRRQDQPPGPEHEHRHDHRPVAVIREMIAAADLPNRVAARAQATFTTLAEAEGVIHGLAADDVELHEAGALDAIIDIVGACAALEVLDVDEVRCGPISVGTGIVRAAHGVLPNPSPAVVGMLARRQAPAIGVDDTLELATPTGVALMTALASEFGPLPPMHVERVGYGAGKADTPGRPNTVQVVIGTLIDAAAGAAVPAPGQAALLVEANVDDVTAEVLAHTVSALLGAGAHDAWITPTVMKKGRPAHTVHALCDAACLEPVSRVLVAETGTLGLRATDTRRWPQHRDHGTVDVDGQTIRVKRAAGRVKVEHDDAARAAAVLRLPLREVIRRAENASGPPPA